MPNNKQVDAAFQAAMEEEWRLWQQLKGLGPEIPGRNTALWAQWRQAREQLNAARSAWMMTVALGLSPSDDGGKRARI